MRKLYLSCLLLLFAMFPGQTIFGYDFKIISHINEKGPMPDDCHRMGVSSVWFYSGLPVKITNKGDLAWSTEDAKRKIGNIFEHFENTGIKVIPLTNVFYEKFQKEGQISRFSDKPVYRCFSSSNEDIIKRIVFFVRELSKFKSFGGICIDDEPGIQPGGCICENCISLFKQQYGINHPSSEEFLNAPKGIVSENNPILLWQKFQEEQILKYYTSVANAIKKESPNCLVLNIPAAAYFSGKQLTVPDCKSEDFIRANRRVTLDNCHIRDFQLYVQFYMNEITSSGWENKIADGLCLYMMDKGLVNFTNLPIYDKFNVKMAQQTVISPLAFKRFILQTFSEGAHGIVYFPGRSLSEEHLNVAADVYKKFIQPVCHSVSQLHKFKGQTAILYSNTTRTFADLWINNPVERYKHLHECDALAYYLFKKGIPFEILMEERITNADTLKRFSLILSAGLDYLTEKKAEILSEYTKNGGKLICDKKSLVNILGSISVDFDAESWYRTVKTGSQHASDMEAQATFLDKALSEYLNSSLAICKTSCRDLNINYLTDGKNVYLFIVNDNLDDPVSAELNLDKEYDILDVLAQKTFGKNNNFRITVAPAELKMLKLNHDKL